MTIQYKTVWWRFDIAAWCSAIAAAIPEEEVEIWAALLEVHPNTLQRWRRGTGISKQFPYPNMTNFLNFVNALDLKPAQFFIISDD